MKLNNLIFLAEETTMGEAALNTLMGMSIVFVALAFISFIIYLLGLLGGGRKKKTADKAAEIVRTVEVESEPETEPEEELSSDEELVAVITAAIYAYEAEQGYEIPTDGLFVRSIRRSRRMA